MRKLRVILIILAVGLLTLLLHDFFTRSSLPPGQIYQGKPIREWVRLCVDKRENSFSDGLVEPGMPQIYSLGPEAVPYLIEAINRQPALIESRVYAGIYTNLPGFMAAKFPKPREFYVRQFRAFFALSQMGSGAKTAVPFLASQLATNMGCLDLAKSALIKLGTNALEAIPSLTNSFNSTNFGVHVEAARALSVLWPEYPELVPKLLSETKSTNATDRRWACIVLAEIKTHQPEIEKALHQALNDPDTNVQQSAQRAIKYREQNP